MSIRSIRCGLIKTATLPRSHNLDTFGNWIKNNCFQTAPKHRKRPLAYLYGGSGQSFGLIQSPSSYFYLFPRVS